MVNKFKYGLEIMKNPLTFGDKCNISSTLLDLAYRDYIASRFLLNNQFIIQGLTLASTAVEKYLKSIIVFNSSEKKNYHFHFDNVEKLKNAVSDCYDISERFDPVFLNILEKAFKIRYYDNLKEEIEIGIYLNQFLGELDATVFNLETFIADTQNFSRKFSSYWKAVESKEQNLFKNNFVLKKKDKKEFMEKPGFAFSIHIKAGLGFNSQSTCLGKKISVEYNGRMSIFDEFLPSGEMARLNAYFGQNLKN